MKFLKALDRIRRWQRLGRLAAAVAATVAVFAVLGLVLGLTDAWIGFEPGVRLALVAAAWVLVGLTMVWGLIVALRFSRKQTSIIADDLSGSPRSIGTSALSLSAQKADSELGEFLSQRLIDDAAQKLSAVPVTCMIPWRLMARAGIACVVCLLPVVIIALAAPRAAQTILQRLQQPSADLPPWSRLIFAVAPAKPECIYGGEVTVAVNISGSKEDLEHPVECLVRHSGTGEISRLPAFRESPTRFSRTLDGVTEPIDLAFACGRARSGWHPVALLLQPKVLAGKVTITPPGYIGLGPMEMPLDRNEISALEGSEIELDLTSNRPPADSELTFTPLAMPGREASPRQIEGRAQEAHHIVFRWTVTGSGQIVATLKDVRGTPSATPFELSLRAVPDQAPLAELQSPPRLLLATPQAKVKLQGSAEDDYALSRVQLIRTLTGFRDRAQVVASALQYRGHEFSNQLDLGGIGAEPGQTIELYLEASDHNPSLLGQGASEISRIRIITEDEYAARIRAQTTLEEFKIRFRLIQDARRDAVRLLEAMKKAAIDGDAEALEAARKEAAEAHRQAVELLDKLADEFPAFEAEKRLQDVAREQARKFAENQGQLDKFNPNGDPEANKKAIEKMLERFGEPDPGFNKLERDAEMMAEAGAILEMAAKFKQIYANQQSVTKRIRTLTKELAMGKDANRRLLPLLAETQRKNRRALDDFAKQLKERADAMKHPDLEELKASALDFHQRLLLADPGSAMDLAAESGDKGKANDALVNAELALAMLERLMNHPDPFSEACQNGKIDIPGPMLDINKTMQQLLEAMMNQNRGGEPGQQAGGDGMGGMGADGNARPGFADLNVPVVGPERMSFIPEAMSAEAKGSGRGGRGAGPGQASETEHINPNERQHAGEAGPNLEKVPDAYREAVKSYFLPDEK